MIVQVGAETFRMCRQLVDGVVLVDNAEISAAIKDVFNETRSILEPAGAVAVAGAKAWLKENKHKVGHMARDIQRCRGSSSQLSQAIIVVTSCP